ncbi:hypothetical protein HK096_007133 [Nowakowskiella sp. JEL0078]|nr:hypothetical protein HK096_007133 [Nowakowskiella sp. JEL0078]
MGNKLSLIKTAYIKRNSIVNISKTDDRNKTSLNSNSQPTENESSSMAVLSSIVRNNSILSNSSIPKSENSKVNSQKESLILNEKIAEEWQPQYDHSLRSDARLDNLRRFHNIKESPYFLPADIEEQDRLEVQHLISTHYFGGLFRMPIKEILLKPGTKILDVGCGPGSWVRDMAVAYPLCDVHAVVRHNA